jgi:cation diffusion facilitator family transporter
MKTSRIALNVAAAALVLAAAKAAAGIVSGSITLLSSALDSAGDAFASFTNFVLLTIAAKPPDEDHPFGHGKAEHLAALAQGAILLAGAIAIAWRAVGRIRDPRPIGAETAAIAAMLLSIVATIGITTYLKRHAVRSESSALAADALHYTTDIAANLAAIAALVLVRITGNPLFDSGFGIVVAGWVAWSAAMVLWSASNDLMDAALPESELAAVIDAIERADPSVISHRELRTRRSAGVRFIDLELCIDRNVSFEHAHEVTEKVKASIREKFPRAVITVHAEPV